jgi:hypothetical protein
MNRAWASQPWPLSSASTRRRAAQNRAASRTNELRCVAGAPQPVDTVHNGQVVRGCVCVSRCVCKNVCTCVHTPHRRFQQKFGFTSIEPLNRQEYKTKAPPWETPLGTLEGDLCKRTLTSVLATPLTRATMLSERVAPCIHA